MSSFDKYLQVLNSLIFEEERVVSYKCLGQYLGVHLNIAKQILLKFANTQSTSEKGVHAIFYLCGITQDDRSLVTLVPQEELESTKSAFKSLSSVHVYSIQLSKPINSSVVVPTNREFRTLTVNDPTTINQIINNKNITVKDSQKKPHSINTSTVNQQSSSAHSKPSNKSSSQQQRHAENSLVSKSQTSSRLKTSTKALLDKKSLNIKKVNGKTSPKTKTASKITGKKSKEPKRIIVEISDDEDEENEEERDRRLASMNEMTMENNEQQTTITSQESIPKRRRAKRKIAKQRTSKNSRGYDVVENVYESESYSEDDFETPPPQPTYKPKPKTMTTKPQQQQSEKPLTENSEKPKKTSKKKNSVMPGQSKLSAFWKK
ncbi:12001_t:CDS:10 [Ambispora gerdemannii]|uniref:DNA polymerase delta subunit 3 n=1 Tax=Ambispora gerdemannii TaxID=144530 RepID=A0A9N8VTB7_9GLOM|nr:12001_t:CDS:10 [Ambispora gerdemannii]